jgi:hypothetical protein
VKVLRVLKKILERLPIGECPIVSSQEWRPTYRRDTPLLGDPFVKVNAKARSVRGVCEAILPSDLLREEVGGEASWTAWHLLDTDVGGGHAKGDTGCGGDGAERVVRGDVDVVGLAPVGDLQGLG